MWESVQASIIQFIGTTKTSEMVSYEKILYLIGEYGPSYLNGAKNTFLIALISTLLGCIIGLAVGIGQTTPVSKRDPLLKRIGVKLLKGFLAVYVEVFRGTPMMIQAVFIYYGMPLLMGGRFMDWFTAAVFIVSINTGAYMAETVRGGILSIDPGQTEGAKAIGMTHVQTMVHVILPQTLRNIMPQIGNNLIINVKDTCVLSIISVVELFFIHKGVAGALYLFFESAAITMVIYLTMTLFLTWILRWVEKKMDGKDHYDLATTDTLAHTTGTYSYPGKGSNFDERNVETEEAARRNQENRNQNVRGEL